MTENAFEQKKESRINRPSKNWAQIIFFYFICHTLIVKTSKKLLRLVSTQLTRTFTQFLSVFTFREIYNLSLQFVLFFFIHNIQQVSFHLIQKLDPTWLILLLSLCNLNCT